ncbi:cobaltochelatase subunit CobN [Anopheles sinensis]|uniref:Cobaltochelatase subunit CobN n=1 Tax=Anopheles sinensis TaxID=74873 RepID=A0A084W3M8_ANOSI|nr:cobaltochelatase subunit CobN [Anopheles sinensis]
MTNGISGIRQAFYSTLCRSRVTSVATPWRITGAVYQVFYLASIITILHPVPPSPHPIVSSTGEPLEWGLIVMEFVLHSSNPLRTAPPSAPSRCLGKSGRVVGHGRSGGKNSNEPKLISSCRFITPCFRQRGLAEEAGSFEKIPTPEQDK